MTSTCPMSLPRPENRCRGDLERWVGCRGAGPNWRSEGFAEDVVLALPFANADASAGAGATAPSNSSAAANHPVRRRIAKPLLWLDRLSSRRG